jgi:hypothetical protein
MPDDYSGKAPAITNPFFKESGYPGTKKWEEWVREQDEKKNIVNNTENASTKMDLGKVFRWGPKQTEQPPQVVDDSFYEFLTCQLLSYKDIRDGWKEHTKNWEVYDLMVREYTKLITRFEVYLKQQLVDLGENPLAIICTMALRTLNKEQFLALKQWVDSYFPATESNDQRNTFSVEAMDWQTFVKARYPDACIKKEGIEFIVYCPLLKIRLSDFCQTEDEAWCSAKIKIRNKG